MFVIGDFKVNKDITQDLEKIKTKQTTQKPIIWERDLHMMTHLAIWTLYFNLSCPLEDFQDDVKNSYYKERGGWEAGKERNLVTLLTLDCRCMDSVTGNSGLSV